MVRKGSRVQIPEEAQPEGHACVALAVSPHPGPLPTEVVQWEAAALRLPSFAACRRRVARSDRPVHVALVHGGWFKSRRRPDPSGQVGVAPQLPLWTVGRPSYGRGPLGSGCASLAVICCPSPYRSMRWMTRNSCSGHSGGLPTEGVHREAAALEGAVFDVGALVERPRTGYWPITWFFSSTMTTIGFVGCDSSATSS